jgi:hypothetical protein
MISAMAAPRWDLLVAVIAAGALAAGCGSGGARSAAKPHQRLAHAPATGGTAPGSSAPATPTPPSAGVPADLASVKVIRAWASALRRGDVRSAARYFRLPSLFSNGESNGGAASVVIHTERQALEANATLPCGAVFISAQLRGPYINALFRLTSRPGPGGGDCGSGLGQTARTNFIVANGHILAWLRAPDDPGDNSGPPKPQPVVPAAPQSPSPTI